MSNDESKLKELETAVFTKMGQKITDLVFLEIQNDRELMKIYLDAVHKHGQEATNRHLGKRVKENFSLTNAENREGEPESTLISSHQVFLH